MTARRKPTVAVIGTGGTIASVGGDGLELVRYIDRKQMLPIDGLLARTPELAQVADVTPVAYDVLQSHGIGPRDWLALVSRIHALIAGRPGRYMLPPHPGPAGRTCAARYTGVRSTNSREASRAHGVPLRHREGNAPNSSSHRRRKRHESRRSSVRGLAPVPA